MDYKNVMIKTFELKIAKTLRLVDQNENYGKIKQDTTHFHGIIVFHNTISRSRIDFSNKGFKEFLTFFHF